MTKLIKKLVGRSKIVCKTGLHIGGSSDSTEIGGLDNPVIRRAGDGQPYIPGSSLKGKMRCLLQQVHGQLEFYDAVEEEPVEKTEGNPKLTVAMLFGSGVDKSKGEKDGGYASKIIFRDAHLTKASIKKLEASTYTVMPYTELKQENTIDRVTGVTVDGGIRTMERVPAESEFEFEVVINIYEQEHDEQEYVKSYLRLFHMGLRLLEHDYLGGSGSRGYGHIVFKDFNWEVIDMTIIQQQSIPTTWETQVTSQPT